MDAIVATVISRKRLGYSVFSLAVEEVAISKNKAQLSEAQLGLIFS
jgi:hypothetical protein